MGSGCVWRRLCILLYVFANLLFILKYGGRLFEGAQWLFGLLYVAVCACLFGYKRQIIPYKIVSGGFFSLGITIILTAWVAIASKIDPYSIHVDRWSAICNWWTALLNGEFPYSANTHLGGYGSPFPVWQLLQFPFFLLKKTGFAIVVFLTMYYTVLRQLYNKMVAAKAAAMMVLSPALVYELMVQSDLLANFLLLAYIIILLEYKRYTIVEHPMAFAVLCGLVLSTRLSVALPLMIYLLADYLRLSRMWKLCFPLVVVAVFLLTFSFLLLWGTDNLFFEYNPFVLQTRQGHLVDVIILLVAIFFAAMRWKPSLQRYMMYTGVVMTGFVALTFVHNMAISGDFTGLFSSAYDITYFDMALPFLVAGLSIEKQC